MTIEFLEELGLTEEQIDKVLMAEDFEEIDKKPKWIMHCKPCANFQTVEFDYEISGVEDLPAMFDLYNTIQEELQKIGVEETVKKPATKKPVKNVELISDSQKALMKQIGLKYTDDMTMGEARLKLKKALEK